VADGDRGGKIVLTPRRVMDKAAFALALDACASDEARETIEEMILESGVELTADDRAWVGYRERMVTAVVEWMSIRWASNATSAERGKRVKDIVRDLAKGDADPDYKPPWKAKNEHQKQWMAAWVVDQLCAVQRAASAELKAETDAERAAALGPRQDGALEAARYGDFEALREIVSELASKAFGPEYGPRFAEQVNPERAQSSSVLDAYGTQLRLACCDVHDINNLFVDEYGKKKRHHDLVPAVVEVPAMMRDVSEADLENARKKFKPPHYMPIQRVPRGRRKTAPRG
jgi:hypothetical protein